MSMTTTKLFHVRTIMKEFDGYKNVPVDWICVPERSARPRPYYQLIEGGEQLALAPYAFEAIDEMFSEDEARQLIAYLVRGHGEEFNTITTVKLPIPRNSVSLDALRKYRFSLDKAPGYSLPFKVAGYPLYDGCERLVLDTDEVCPF